MIEITSGLLMGLVTGILFFGGLWWTVRRATNSSLAPLSFLLSFFVRMGLVAAGLYLISGLGWQALVACGVGIFLVRTAFVALMRRGPGYSATEQERAV